MKHQLDELVYKSQQLAEESQRLSEENRKLKELIARLQAGSPAENAAPGRSSAPSSYAPPRETPSTTTTPSTRITHAVQKGETYYSIAKRYGVTPAALQEANPGVDPNRLQIGQRLMVPSR
jgi:LysM repeat protein